MKLGVLLIVLAPLAASAQQAEIQRALIERDRQSAEFARRKRGFGCIWKRPRPTRPTKRSSRREEAHSKAELSQSLVTSAATGNGVFPCAEDGERVE